MNFQEISDSTRLYNFHSHTEYCDGRAPMAEMAVAARSAGMKYYGFSPHSPIPVESPCNMLPEKVEEYIAQSREIAERYRGDTIFLTSMEIDFLSADWGPHIDYFQRLPLDYRIGSVHFVPTMEGVPIDCDGRYESFSRKLHDFFGGDLRYVVEKYFEQLITMIERGGFEMLGHLDRIAGNAAMAQPGIENEKWYEGLIAHAISAATTAGLTVEINTKAYADKSRFFPAERWWRKVIDAGLPIVVNSDAHFPDKITAGRQEAFDRLDQMIFKQQCYLRNLR